MLKLLTYSNFMTPPPRLNAEFKLKVLNEEIRVLNVPEV